jgi:hypothetical protein
MNYSTHSQPVISLKKYLFLLSYFLTYCWPAEIDESSNPQIFTLSTQNHLNPIVLVKSVFFNGLTPLVSEQTKGDHHE